VLIDDKVRLKSLLRAMDDVVLPALPKDAQLAVEQAHLVRMHLNMMLAQADHAYRLQLAELAHFTALLRDLEACGLAAELEAAASAQVVEILARAAPIAALEVPDSESLARLTREVREAADSLVQSVVATDSPLRKRASHIVLDYAARQITRERVAAKAAGFELDPGSLPDLKDVT
jgi:hypothetical protein